jgi:hypothetical protein
VVAICVPAGVGVLERVLIDTERLEVLETVVGCDQRIAEVDHRLMRGCPADTEVPSGGGDRVVVLADAAANLTPCPLSQRRPRRDLRRGL